MMKILFGLNKYFLLGRFWQKIEMIIQLLYKNWYSHGQKFLFIKNCYALKENKHIIQSHNFLLKRIQGMPVFQDDVI